MNELRAKHLIKLFSFSSLITREHVEHPVWRSNQTDLWHLTCVDSLTKAWAIKEIEINILSTVGIQWQNKTQEGVCCLIEKLIFPLHPSKPQRPNKTTSSETEVWLWKTSVLYSSLWGFYEMYSSNALIVSLFFPMLTKIHHCVNCARKYSISVYELSWVHLVTLVNVEISFTYQQSSTALHLHG